ncbi:neutral zinc metallopeptidase [Actinosynnema sp. NPDC047251]|uniref:Metalloprotease-like protein n=1 Tax=Saccharothrix espanaensis (strain ATCC 51144 / DSM 44229 / JCM 9112 / NBRC 15066 / NRRL 15764) TaxID=1179773 RepID=K0K811_SACES|nr:neutral zinc metallopeptidase [Saccharothrix espanaensis]CCH34516.1 Metalloprotease-like protein [Saccharothrix espanaensis DSM 44229]
MRHASGRLILLVAVVSTALVASACTQAVPGRPVAGKVVAKDGVDPSFIKGTDGGDIDRLGATAITDVDKYWEQAYPATFGEKWRPIEGGVYSVDTADPAAKPPPCTEKASDVEGNAFYCPSADAIAWDRAALLPVLRDGYGDAAVVIVLAHEMGHAVQRRMGITPEAERKNPEKYPTILTEAMADCFAGSFIRWVNDGKSEHLDIGTDTLDAALGALISFRDPVGTSPNDKSAHGNAFDRVSAFQDGYQEGTKFCSGMTVQTRKFTQQGFTNVDDRDRGGNLPFDEMLDAITPDLDNYYKALVTSKGKTWTPPKTTPTQKEPDCSGDQGPVAFCPKDKSVEIEVAEELPELHAKIGDYATGILLASRYGMAARAALGKEVDGDEASAGALCLAGAYTREVFTRRQGFGLSPGDLDEAVKVLLAYDYAARDGSGEASVAPGFKRVDVFRSGVFVGDKACGLG